LYRRAVCECERLKLDNHSVEFIDSDIPIDIFTLNTNIKEKEMLLYYISKIL